MSQHVPPPAAVEYPSSDGKPMAENERLGVKEYWQYDPTGEHLGVRLKGWRLVEGAHEPQPVVASLDGTRFL